jgi:hypothetical protein
MNHSASIPQLESKFDAFLFAPVDDDENGMVLSVLSALARSNVDPWLEAASLARMPEHTAIERLTSLICALPDGPSVRRDPARIAARLIALLPRKADSEASCQALLGVDPTADSHVLARLIWINVIFIAFMLGALSLAKTPPQSQGTSAATSHTAPAQTSTPDLGGGGHP